MSSVQNSTKLYVALLTIIVGAFDTLVYKTQNRQFVDEGGHRKYFFHPFMQVAAMFLGEMMALLVYFFHKTSNSDSYAIRAQKAKQQGKSLQFNKFKFAIPALCDCLASNFQLFALNFISGSVYQMLQGGSIVTTFIFSLVFLQLKAELYQIIGSALAFIGVAIVGISAILFAGKEKTEEELTMHLIGYLMLILSLICDGFQFSYEQTLFSKYHVDPLLMVGYEGVVGFLFQCLIIISLNFTPCSFGINACTYNKNGKAFIQNTPSYFSSISQSSLLLLFVLLGMLTFMVFNVSGATVTKYISALVRSICNVTRTLLIWLIGIIVTLTLGKQQQNYRWQTIKLNEIILQTVGFIILILGNLIYNNIVRFECLQKSNEDETHLCQDIE